MDDALPWAASCGGLKEASAVGSQRLITGWGQWYRGPCPKLRVSERMDVEEEDEEEEDSRFGELSERVAEVALEASRQYQRIDAGIVDGHSRGEALQRVDGQW